VPWHARTCPGIFVSGDAAEIRITVDFLSHCRRLSWTRADKSRQTDFGTSGYLVTEPKDDVKPCQNFSQRGRWRRRDRNAMLPAPSCATKSRTAPGCGLYLSVEPTGTKSWVQRYRDAAGKPKRRKLGGVNRMSLAAARAAAAATRHRIEVNPTDPPGET